jgi:putative glutamine amidotransferase
MLVTARQFAVQSAPDVVPAGILSTGLAARQPVWHRTPAMRSVRPLIGVISDRRTLGHHAFQVQGEKYLTAIVAGAGGYPLGLPVLGPGIGAEFDLLEVLETLGGLLLTGSPSNVEPHRYQGPASRDGTLHDPERDHSAFELIPAVVRRGIPLLAVCRGFQELNVAYGGTLHQEVHNVPGRLNHREDKTAPVEAQYAPAHEVRFSPGGMLATITGKTLAMVNSVHSQGIDRLGDGLRVEGTAPDGLIEAVTVADAPGFVLGVQWHPEWRVRENEVSMAIFRAFGDACRSYRS